MAWTLHEGDALTILDQLPADSIDAVIADPPYNSGGRTPTERTTQTARGKYVTGRLGDVKNELPDFAGDNRDQLGYIAWLGVVLSKCLHVTRLGGAVLVFCDWRQLNATTNALQVGGWTLRGVGVWHKPIARPQPGRLRQECEFIVWGSNGPMRPGANPVYLPGLYSGSQPRGTERQHITQKPLDVMRQLVRIVPEDGTVLDPFAGSGTTGVAALQEGRNFVGCEITSHYAQIARERLTQAS